MSMYSKHSYYEYKGREVPSVTTILSILNKPALVNWANYMGFKRQKVSDILERSSLIGTSTHGYIEKWFNPDCGFKPTGEMKEYSYEVALRLDSFLQWAKEQELKPLHLEEKLEMDTYGGTVDFIGYLNGELVIMDFKTSSNVYPSMYLQLAGYCKAVEHIHGYRIEKVGIVHIKDEKTRWLPISRGEVEPYIESFDKLVEFFHLWFDLNHRNGKSIL